MGFSDKRLADLAVRSLHLRSDARTLARGRGLIGETMRALAGASTEEEVRALRHRLGVRPCSSASTPARGVRGQDALHVFDLRGAELRRAGGRERPTARRKIAILGGGPNRIGQGIEFDYCCCHACFALKDAGFETVMINCNPGDGEHRLRHVRPASISSR
jgi:carbamoyl-phosphate synthase large subunit